MTHLFVLFLKILPKNLVSRFVGFLADRAISRIAIRSFARAYKVNMEEAEYPIEHYKTLNTFFTRHLKKEVRPIAAVENKRAVTSPVDGRLDQMGTIEEGRLIQAKGLNYHLSQLLGSDTEAEKFIGGTFLTIYLAPPDYHRIHHYVDGVITGFRYVPGTLYPVNKISVTHVPNLFAINERLTTYIQSEKSETAIVKVGATIVGKIKVAYDSIESNLGQKGLGKTFLKPIPVKKGDELGLFQMGSTVILLFQKGQFEPRGIQSGCRVVMGQEIGSLN